MLLFFVFVFVFWPSHVACGTLVPLPEIESGPSAVKAQSPNYWTAGEFLILLCFVHIFQTLPSKGGCEPG